MSLCLAASTDMGMGMHAQISGLEYELNLVVKNKTLEHVDTLSPQGALTQLYGSVRELKTKASLAETAVCNILADPSNSELTKSRLRNASGSKTQLLVLTDLFSELDMEVNGDYSFERLAFILTRVNDIFKTVERFVLIPRLDNLRQRYARHISGLRRKIFRAYREIGQIMDGVSNSCPGTVSHYSDAIIKSLSNAYMVVDCMGPDVVEELMDEIVQTQLLAYDTMGREGGPLFKLDKETFERRWNGLRKLLYAAEHRMGHICPAGWMLPHRLYLDFCDRTARHLRLLLGEEAARYRSDCYAAMGNVCGNSDAFLRDALNTPAGVTETQAHVGLLVQALKSVLSLEEEMNARFEDDSLSLTAASKAEEEVLARLAQGGIMSCVFDNFMQPYVLLEKRTLESTVQGLVDGDGATQQGAVEAARAHVVYDSAGRLFEAIRNSMKRCLALTCGKSFLLLCNEYAGSTSIYASALRSRCPQLTENAAVPMSGKINKGLHAATMTVSEEVLACRVINTAEYCAEVVPKLEAQIKQKIHMTLAKEVDMTSHGDMFMDVVAYAIDELVAGLLGRTDSALKEMKKVSWGTFQSVGDDSSYVGMLRSVLMECIPRIRHALSPLWFKNFCTHFSTDFLDQFLNSIMMQKKICPVGAEQLLLDTNSMKTVITQIHHLGLSASDPKRHESPIPGPYTSVVTGRFKHIEVVLKLVCIEEDQFEEMFAIMWPEGEVADMQAILELKHNPSMISSAASAVGDISGATTRGTKSAIASTSRAFGAVGSTSRALGGSVSKSLNMFKTKATRRSSVMSKDGVDHDAR